MGTHNIAFYAAIWKIRSLNHHQISTFTVMILSFRADRSGQTAQTKIKVYTVCHSVCMFSTPYSLLKPNSSSFRIITTLWGCPNF